MAKKPKEKDEDENSSDFEEISLLTKLENEQLQDFGKILIQSAVGELRKEFQKLVTQAVETAINSDSADDLHSQVDKQEKQLMKMKNELERLREEGKKQKGGNKDLERKISEKEKEIKVKELQISQLKKRLQKYLKEFTEEQLRRDRIEAELKQDLYEVKQRYNNLRGKQLAKEAAENIARDKIAELRARIEELENELRILRARRH